MSLNSVYTIQKNISTGDVKLHQTTMMSLIELAHNRYKGHKIKSPRMVESGVVKFGVFEEQDYLYETWLIPQAKLGAWLDMFYEWIESCNPIPFVTFWYEGLIDGANQIISAIDPDNLLTSDFVDWLEKEGNDEK